MDTFSLRRVSKGETAMRTVVFNVLILLTISFFTIFLYFQSENAVVPYRVLRQFSLSEPQDSSPVAAIKPGNRWIVVTSVSSPTNDVLRLAAFADWNLVVVADTKTPVDWSVPGVHFLSVDYQKSLPFEIYAYLPYKSYTRKNIGYLYAILHGAEWIYDTDDDNKPYGLGLQQFEYQDNVSGLRYRSLDGSQNISSKLFNPYRFFGLHDMWPRGFPLEYLSEHVNGKEQLALCQTMPRSAVQQGLVHHDPDVDAIYRLLHADRQTGLDERFNKFTPPVVLSPGTYAPWNSQNTLFHKSAFHTLFLPTTVSFRTTDIWRSYYAQRILHLSGLTVSFTPVNAVQYRNAHDFLKDFEDEKQVYKDAGKIVSVIDEWKCSMRKVDECMRELARIFVETEIWKQDDEELINSFIADLKTIGYEFPPIVDEESYETKLKVSTNESERYVNCRRANIAFDLDYPDNSTNPAFQRAEMKENYFGDIADWCNETGVTSLSLGMPSPENLAEKHSQSYVFQKNLNNVLVITNNYDWKWGIGLLQRLYQPYFATVIFCGSWYPDNYTMNDQGFPKMMEPFNYIHVTPAEMRKGYFGYHCLTLVKEMRLSNVDGYFIMSDDAHFNIWQRIDFSRVHHLTGVQHENSGQWWGGDVGIKAARRIVKTVNETSDEKVKLVWSKFETGLRKYGYINGSKTAFDDLLSGKSRSVSDFFYVPASQIEFYADLMRIFFKGGLFHELAVNRFLRAVPHQTSRELNNAYLWGKRNKWAEIYTKNMIAMHPIKISGFSKPGKDRAKYCKTVLTTWKNIVFEGSTNYTIKKDTDKDWKNG